jgi:perosamine synthetase
MTQSATGVSRKVFCEALKAEGLPIFEGYVKPLYLLPVFQKRIAIGGKGFPFDLTERTYQKGLCPVTERMHEQELIGVSVCSYALPQSELDQVIEGITKVYKNRSELTQVARQEVLAK